MTIDYKGVQDAVVAHIDRLSDCYGLTVPEFVETAFAQYYTTLGDALAAPFEEAIAVGQMRDVPLVFTYDADEDVLTLSAEGHKLLEAPAERLLSDDCDSAIADAYEAAGHTLDAGEWGLYDGSAYTGHGSAIYYCHFCGGYATDTPSDYAVAEFDGRVYDYRLAKASEAFAKAAAHAEAEGVEYERALDDAVDHAIATFWSYDATSLADRIERETQRTEAFAVVHRKGKDWYITPSLVSVGNYYTCLAGDHAVNFVELAYYDPILLNIPETLRPDTFKQDVSVALKALQFAFAVIGDDAAGQYWNAVNISVGEGDE